MFNYYLNKHLNLKQLIIIIIKIIIFIMPHIKKKIFPLKILTQNNKK